jgi:nucleolar protein 16
LRLIQPEGEEEVIAGRKRRKANPLEDPLNELTEAYNDIAIPESSSHVVKALEQQVAQEEAAVKRRRPRQQSKREEEWIERLVERHGDDVRTMARDKRLNPMQQSEGDLARRVRLWKGRRG